MKRNYGAERIVDTFAAKNLHMPETRGVMQGERCYSVPGEYGFDLYKYRHELWVEWVRKECISKQTDEAGRIEIRGLDELDLMDRYHMLFDKDKDNEFEAFLCL